MDGLVGSLNARRSLISGDFVFDSTSKMASKVLSEWKTSLINHAIEHQRWVFSGELDLVYLPANDGGCTSSYMNPKSILNDHSERRTVETGWEIVTGMHH